MGRISWLNGQKDTSYKTPHGTQAKTSNFYVVAVVRHQMFLVFLWFHMSFREVSLKISLSEWSTKLLRIACLVGEIKLKVLFCGPLAEWVIQLNFESCTDLWECKSLMESATAHSSIIILWIVFLGMSFCGFQQMFFGFSTFPLFPHWKMADFRTTKSCSSICFWVVICFR